MVPDAKIWLSVCLQPWLVICLPAEIHNGDTYTQPLVGNNLRTWWDWGVGFCVATVSRLAACSERVASGVWQPPGSRAICTYHYGSRETIDPQLKIDCTRDPAVLLKGYFISAHYSPLITQWPIQGEDIHRHFQSSRPRGLLACGGRLWFLLLPPLLLLFFFSPSVANWTTRIALTV